MTTQANSYTILRSPSNFFDKRFNDTNFYFDDISSDALEFAQDMRIRIRMDNSSTFESLDHENASKHTCISMYRIGVTCYCYKIRLCIDYRYIVTRIIPVQKEPRGAGTRLACLMSLMAMILATSQSLAWTSGMISRWSVSDWDAAVCDMERSHQCCLSSAGWWCWCGGFARAVGCREFPGRRGPLFV